MKKRKKLINKKLQMKTTLPVMGISIVTFFIIISLVGVIVINHRTRVSGTLTELNEAVKTEDDIVHAFLEYSRRTSGDKTKLYASRVASDHEKSIAVLKKYVTHIEEFVKEYYLIIFMLIAIAILQSIIYFIYMINKTLTIAGPVHVITSHVLDMINGKKPDFRPLRKNDEFKELYEKLKVLADRIDLKE